MTTNALPELAELERVLRRHHVWLDFLAHAACAYRHWLPTAPERSRREEQALARWYRGAIC